VGVSCAAAGAASSRTAGNIERSIGPSRDAVRAPGARRRAANRPNAATTRDDAVAALNLPGEGTKRPVRLYTPLPRAYIAVITTISGK
jgi:hypothetical protein